MSGFWSETGKLAAKYQRQRAQRWLIKHPTTLATILGLKGLTWDFPSWTVRKITGKVKKVKTSTGEEKTVITTVSSTGHISETTVKTTSTTSMPMLSAGTANNPRPGKVSMTPHSKQALSDMVKGARRRLEQTHIGRAYLGLHTELSQFMPVRTLEATTVLDLMAKLHKGLNAVAAGADIWTQTVTESGMHRRVTERIMVAVGEIESASAQVKRSATTFASLYEGQLRQEASIADTLSTVPVPRGVGYDAVMVGRLCDDIRAQYIGFQLEPNLEASQIMDYLQISRAGIAMAATGVEQMALRLPNHGIDKKAVRVISMVAGSLTDAAYAWRQSVRTMAPLYRGQIDHERSGVQTVRTAPLHTVAA